jgi:hypothetical protein
MCNVRFLCTSLISATSEQELIIVDTHSLLSPYAGMYLLWDYWQYSVYFVDLNAVVIWKKLSHPDKKYCQSTQVMMQDFTENCVILNTLSIYIPAYLHAVIYFKGFIGRPIYLLTGTVIRDLQLLEPNL